MTNENSRVDYFLNTNGSGITLELGTALIAKFGGVEAFLAGYKGYGTDAMLRGRSDAKRELENDIFYNENKVELSMLMLEMAECSGRDSAILHIHEGIEKDLDNNANLDEIAQVYFHLEYRKTHSTNEIIDWIIFCATEQLCLAFDAEYEYYQPIQN